MFVNDEKLVRCRITVHKSINAYLSLSDNCESVAYHRFHFVLIVWNCYAWNYVFYDCEYRHPSRDLVGTVDQWNMALNQLYLVLVETVKECFVWLFFGE